MDERTMPFMRSFPPTSVCVLSLVSMFMAYLLSGCASVNHVPKATLTANAKSWYDICPPDPPQSRTLRVGGKCAERMRDLSAQAACAAGNHLGCSYGLVPRVESAQDPRGAIDEIMPILEEGCKAGDEISCLTATSLLGRLEHPDMVRRWKNVYRRACRAGSGHACYVLGRLNEDTARGQRHQVLAAGYYQRACEHDYGPGCAGFGRMSLSGKGVDRDEERGRALFRRACALGERHVCEPEHAAPPPDNLFHRTAFGSRSAHHFEMFQVACDSGFKHACTFTAKLIQRGSFGRKYLVDAELITDLYRRGCELGAAESCYLLAGRLRYGRGVDEDLEQAIAVAKKACEANSDRGCTRFRTYRYSIFDDEEASSHEIRCTAGRPQDCFWAGMALLDAPKVRPNRPRALELLERGCDSDDPLACQALASAILEVDTGRGSLADDLLVKACDLGQMKACFQLARRHDQGLVANAKHNLDSARMLYERACKGDYARACWRASENHRYRPGDNGLEDARYWADQGCIRNEGRSCLRMARWNRSGKGGKEDLPYARLMFQRTCNLGVSLGCHFLAEMLESATGVSSGRLSPEVDSPSPDPIGAAYYYARACDDAYSPACTALARMYREGSGVARNEQEALKYTKKACTVGGDWAHRACERVAIYLAYRLEDAPTPKRAREFLLAACRDGSDDACYFVARHKVSGELFPRAPHEGLMELTRYCASKPGRCLSMFAVFSMADFAVDLDQYSDMLLLACERGDFVACSAVAGVYAEHLQADAVDPKKLQSAAKHVIEIARRSDDGKADRWPFDHLYRFPRSAFVGLGLDLDQLLERHCQAGSTPLCLRQARFKYVGLTRHRDEKGAKALYKKLCEKFKKSSACEELALINRLEDARATPEQLEAKCEKDDADACLLAGAVHQFGSAEPRRFIAAAKLYERACALGDPKGCAYFKLTRSAKPAPERGREYMAKSLKQCEQEGADTCYTKGRYMAEWLHFERGVELLRLACQKDHDKACAYLDERSLSQDSPPQDPLLQN